MAERCLVTGGAGFMASHVATRLLAEGWKVDVLDDLSGGFRSNIPPGATLFEGSILNREMIGDLFTRRQYKYIFHLAAYAAEGLSHFIRHYNYQNNVIGSVNLINLSVKHKVKCFVFTSSIAVYGAGQLPLREDMTPIPEDPYGIAKYSVELDLRAAHEMFGLNYIVFRPHNVYGERQNLADPYRNVVGIFIRQMLAKKPLTVFGDGEQTRAFSHVDDVCGTIARAAENPRAYQQIYNIGTDEPFTINQLIREMEHAFGRKTDIQYLSERNEVKHAYSAHDRVRSELNYQTTVKLPDGLSRMIEWAKGLEIAESRRFSGIEIERGLPSGWEQYTDRTSG